MQQQQMEQQEITPCEIPPDSPSHSHRPPLEDLLPIPFTDLRLGLTHRGSVAIGALSVPAFIRGSTLWSRLEDDRGRSIAIAVRNALPPDCSAADARELFPQGAKIAVQEPYFLRYDENGGDVGLRVDDPSDVVFLTTDQDDLVKALFSEDHRLDHAELRIEGNRLFAGRDWVGAVRMYSRSITAVEHELERLGDRFAKNTRETELDHLEKYSRKNGTCSSSNSSSGGLISSCMQKMAKTSLSFCSNKDYAPVVAAANEFAGKTFEHELGKKNRKLELDHRCSSSSGSGMCMPKLARSSLSLCANRDHAPGFAAEVDTERERKNNLKHGAAAAADESARKRKILMHGLVSALSNRSESYLRMQRSSEALADADAALGIDPIHVKSLFRKGRALQCMQRFFEAVRCFREAVDLAPGDCDLRRGLEEGLTCEKQSKGEFDFGGYFESEFTGNVPQCVDFVGSVRVGKSGLHVGGRGLFVTRDVEAGELLLVSNPLGMARVSTSADATEELVTQLYARMKTSEENRQRVLGQLGWLFNGTQRSCERMPDMDLVGNQSHGSRGNRDVNSSMDVGRIRRLVRWNAFDERGFATMHQQKTSTSSAGIWFLPSFINHSCVPNVSRIHVGDVMVIRAARDLKAGEELFHPYTDIARPLELRREAIFNGWGFQCSCPRCRLEEKLEESLKAATELYTVLDGGNSTPSSYMSWDRGASTSDYVVRSIRECNRIEAAISNLNVDERMWIRASFTLVFLMAASAIDLQNRAELVNAVRQAVVFVSPGDPQTLKLAAMVAEELKLLQGANSDAYKAAEAVAVHVCNAVFGKQEQRVTKVLINACMRGSLDG